MPDNYITEFARSLAACRACTPTHICIEHCCIDCMTAHAPAAPCRLDMFGRR